MQESETPETKKREKKKKVRGGKRLSRHERKTKKIEGTVSGQASHWQPEVLSKVSGDMSEEVRSWADMSRRLRR